MRHPIREPAPETAVILPVIGAFPRQKQQLNIRALADKQQKVEQMEERGVCSNPSETGGFTVCCG